MEKQLKRLTTEQRNDKSRNLDTAETIDILTIMNEEDKQAAVAVEKMLPEISRAVELTAGSFQKGGRLIYIGAGTSGRLGVLDAVECPPTFSTPPEQVQAVMAGGGGAFMRAAEGAEDSPEEGEKDLRKLELNSKDTVIGIAASGRTPYVAGALQYARQTGANTIALSSNEGAYISGLADCAIETVTGPEILTGSTRLKAATAHKMVLNMISTAAMVATGKVYENLMVDVHVSNHKLKERAVSIIETITGETNEKARAALEAADLQVKRAIVMIQANRTAEQSKVLLEKSGGSVKAAVAAAEKENTL